MSKIVVLSYVMETSLGEFQVFRKKNVLKRFLCRVSRQEAFWEKGVTQNFTKFTGENLCRGPFLVKLDVVSLQLLLK